MDSAPSGCCADDCDQSESHQQALSGGVGVGVEKHEEDGEPVDGKSSVD